MSGVQVFVKALSQLLGTEEADAARRRGIQDEHQLADLLVAEEQITQFQADALLNGQEEDLVFGEYVLVDRLGEGGMGVVYKARHRRMKRLVAVKQLAAAAAAHPELVKRFYREVEVAAALVHPNIVTAYDAGDHQGQLYLVMEFVDGPDLGSVVGKKGPMPLEQAIDLTLQGARGLAYAHERGIVHRDIKPHNMLLGGDGTVKILDMGLARLSAAEHKTELTTGLGVMGTAEYMSPEQASDPRLADARSDIYSLGCCFYCFLAARPPFVGATLMQLLWAHRERPVPDLPMVGGETVPEDVEAVYQRMMAKAPEERFETAEELIEALEALVSSGQVSKWARPKPKSAPKVGTERGANSGSGRVSAPDPTVIQSDTVLGDPGGSTRFSQAADSVPGPDLRDLVEAFDDSDSDNQKTTTQAQAERPSKPPSKLVANEPDELVPGELVSDELVTEDPKPSTQEKPVETSDATKEKQEEPQKQTPSQEEVENKPDLQGLGLRDEPLRSRPGVLPREKGVKRPPRRKPAKPKRRVPILVSLLLWFLILGAIAGGAGVYFLGPPEQWPWVQLALGEDPNKDPGNEEPVKEPVTNPVTEPVKEPVTNPVTEPVKEPVTNPVTEPVKEPSDESGDRARQRASDESVTEPVKEPVTNPVTEPVKEPVTNPITKPVKEPVTNPVTEPVKEPVTNPVTEPVKEPVTNPVTEPVKEPVTNPVTEPVKEPVTNPVTEPVKEPVTNPVTEPVKEPVTNPITEPVKEPVTNPITEPVKEPVTNPITEPVKEPVTNPVTEPVKEPVTNPITEPVKEPVTNPVTEPVKEPVTNPVTEPVKEPVTNPITEPVKEPVTNPVTEPVKEPVTNPITEPVKEPVTNPITEPVKEPVKPVAPLDRGLLAYMKFDGKQIKDEATGKMVDLGTAVSVKNGLADGAVSFARPSDVVKLDGDFSKLDQGMTISLWMYAPRNDRRCQYVVIGEGENTVVLERMARAIKVAVGKHTPHVIFWFPKADRWQHLAVVIDSKGIATIYNEGEFLDAGGVGIPPNVARKSIWLRGPRSTSQPGRLDEVRIYKRALAVDEIRELYQRHK